MKLKVKNVVDIGANTGHYSKLVQTKVSHVVSVDSESVCIDDLYGEIKIGRSKILHHCY